MHHHSNLVAIRDGQVIWRATRHNPSLKGEQQMATAAPPMPGQSRIIVTTEGAERLRSALDRTKYYATRPITWVRTSLNADGPLRRSRFGRWLSKAWGYTKRTVTVFANRFGPLGLIATGISVATTEVGQRNAAKVGRGALRFVTGTVEVAGRYVAAGMKWIPGPTRFVGEKIDSGLLSLRRAHDRFIASPRWNRAGVFLRQDTGPVAVVSLVSRMIAAVKLVGVVYEGANWTYIGSRVSLAASFLKKSERRRMKSWWDNTRADLSKKTDKVVLGDGISIPKPTVVTVTPETQSKHLDHIVELATKQHEKPGVFNSWDQVATVLRGQVTPDFKALLPNGSSRGPTAATKAAGEFAKEITALVKSARDTGDDTSPFSKVPSDEWFAAVRALAEAQIEKFAPQHA